MLCLYESDAPSLCNILVKKSVKYLGIHISKNHGGRQQNFDPKIKNTQQILNMWLRRDIVKQSGGYISAGLTSPLNIEQYK